MKAFILAGILFLASAIWMGARAARMSWQPRVDFDVTGILLLLQNLPKLMMWVLAFVLAGFALYCFRAALTGRAGKLGRLSQKAEDARLFDLYLQTQAKQIEKQKDARTMGSRDVGK